MTVIQSKLSYELGRPLGYQGPRRVIPPTPCDKSARWNHFNIIQINISGLQHKVNELMTLLHEKDARIALIQETILPEKPTNFTTTGYTQHKCECTKCQGIMTLIRDDTQAEVENHPIGDIDMQKVTTWIGKQKYTFYNVYWPNSSCSKFPLNETTYERCIVAGDFNAHTPSLGYQEYNFRGREVEDLCNSSNLILEQDMESEPTLLHRRHLTTTRPDLTLVSADLYDQTTVSVTDDIGSDHRPILIEIKKQQRTEIRRRTFWNYRKAKWNDYARITDEGMNKVDIAALSMDKVSSEICSVIFKASKQAIPRGSFKKFKPFWDKNLKAAVCARREARKKVEKDPTPENRTNYNKHTAKVRFLTRQRKKSKWRETCQNLDLNKNGHKAWKLLKNLEGSSKKENPKPILNNGKKIVEGQKKANHFNKYLAGVSKSTRRTNLDKALWKVFKKKLKAPSCNALPFEQDFTIQELNSAIRKAAPRKAPGPDGITNEMISHLGNLAKKKLLQFINRTWKEGQLPSSWRTAKVTPILKKGKPAGQPKSYRPISLTSCLGKVAERMINTRLYHWLEKNQLLDNVQAGFRKGSRTEDQLFRFVQSAIDGFQDGKSTTAIFIDLQQAYDRVWRKGLLVKMSNMGIHGRMLKWIQSFLSNRTIQTTVDGATSSKKTLEEGLPQGSALSCTLFLIFINDLPPLLNISKALFADDLVIWTTEKYQILARAKLRRALATLNTYCNFWKVKINNQKSVYSIFTRSHVVASNKLNLSLDGVALQKVENPVYLGVTLDRQLNMKPFMNSLKVKASRRLNLVKRLATTTWGADKKTLRQIYLGYVRSAMDYAQSLQTISSKSTANSLDKVQNQSLRLICGGMRSTPTAACEIDANIEPLDLHREKSLLENVERYRRLDENHPNRKLVDSWEPKRRLKQKSPLDVAESLQNHHPLPQERMPDRKHSSTPPWSQLKIPTIKTGLLEENVCKSTDQTILRTCAMETLHTYPTSWIHAYTDGSAFKGTTFAGFGVHLKFPDGTSSDFSDACGNICSNYEAEIMAIKTAIEITRQHFELGEQPPSHVVIFTDSKSALEALENFSDNSHQDIGELAKAIDSLLTSYDIRITLQWIPGHTDIPGNEQADRLAKEGTQKDQPIKPCSNSTVKQILRNNFREVWLNRWATGSTGRVMYSEMDKPRLEDKINNLSRSDQCIIFQFRTGHSKLNNHLNRFNPEHPPLCRNCDHPYETVHHVLFDCQKLQHYRKELLPQQPTISNVLYGPLTQLRNTCKFVKLSFAYKSA